MILQSATLGAQVREYLARHPAANSTEVAAALGALPRSVRKQQAWLDRKARIMGAMAADFRREPVDSPPDHAPDPAHTPRPDASDYLAHATAAADLERRARVDAPASTLVVPFSEPVALVCVADLHIGSLHTDHALVRRVFDLVKRPRWYGINLGDDCQNKHYSGHMEAVISQGLSPLRQKQAALALYAENPAKWVKVPGNHESADSRGGSGDLYTEELAALGVRTLASPAILRVIVGGQEYVGAVAHRFSGSGLHPAAPSLRLLQRHAPTADFALTAHRHRPALVQYHEYDSARAAGLGYGGRKVLGVVGTAQTLRDPYGSQFGDGGNYAILVLVLHPDRHDVAAFWGAEQAEAYMRGLERGDDERQG
jgi:hypothetical protein